MSRLVKLVLIAVGVIFVAGVIWVIIVASRSSQEQKSRGDNQPATTPTLVGEPARTEPPSPTAEIASAPAASSAATKPKRVRTQTTVIVEEEVIQPSGAQAWASAGVNPDGSAFAEARAE